MSELVERLFRHVRDQPDRPAVDDGVTVVSYAAFGGLVRRFAQAVAAAANEPKVLVALPQGAAAYAAMFGTLMAGGVYAPVNVAAPAAKQAAVAARFGPDIVIAAPSSPLARHPGAVAIDPATLPPAALETPRPAQGLAYVIFTSGSTGEPKGVKIPQSALGHYVGWALAAMDVGPADRWSQHPNIAFDLSVLDIYGALCGGACLCPLVSERDRLMPALAIRERRLTIWNSVPSVVRLMMQARQVSRDNLDSLRLMTFCGEPLLPDHLDALFAARPDLVVHNTYGPTEATVSCTVLKLRAEDWRSACRANVALGDAIPGMGLHLVGGPDELSGELVITGPQLAAGYWEAPEQTARAFRPLSGATGEVPAYYTGDWVERDRGRLYFAARIDHQVKINGFRLELGEIEAALSRCGYPGAAVIVAGSVLHAFIEAAEGGLEDAETLRGRLRGQLEPHAVPAVFHRLDHLPRNANDKIDTRKLVELVRPA